jgi:DNA-binding protein H-NS
MSKNFDFDGMSVDEMWQLHEEVSRVLSTRLTAEKRELEKRLAQLRRDSAPAGSEENHMRAGAEARPRRKYPEVLPKYRNPNEPFETWSGRGKQPRWLSAALKQGHKLKDFEISRPGAPRANIQKGRS